MNVTAEPLEWLRLGLTLLGLAVAGYSAADAIQDFRAARRDPHGVRCFVARIWLTIQVTICSLLLVLVGYAVAVLRLPPSRIAQPTSPEIWAIAVMAMALPLGLAGLAVFIGWAQHELRRRVSAILHRRVIRVLVIDDDPTVREMMTTLLESEGYRVKALDVADGLALVAEWPPDVAVVDLMMPDMDGVEVIRRIRRMSPSVRLILYSARQPDVVEHGAALAEADDYLSKPFDIDDLLRRVRGE